MPRAIVAMSGGVDSSVAAALMKDAGYEVTGIMMKLWKGPAANNESGCCSLDAAEDARRVAQVLDIPFYVFNLAEEFSRTVIERFVAGYASGRTPNPCVACNRSIKFSALLRRVRALGAEVLATGHHALAERCLGRMRLRKARDRDKDQSYVLYMLTQEELALARFPVGEYTKKEIREVAASLDLRTARKPESQEICFVPGGDTHAFLSETVPEGSRPGPILDAAGQRIGTHRGFAHYTVGQRRGLGVARGIPLYVREVRPAHNALLVAAGEGIRMSAMDLDEVSFVSGSAPARLRASVMTRYRGPEAEGIVEPRGEGWTVTFDEPQRAASPGQAAVFYEADEVLGGGTILRTC
ncbi:MAG: tRNA 2-thiouridine(34) synthase MnmA [Actinomycetota bacterium]